MIAIVGTVVAEGEDRQRAASLLAGTPLLHDSTFFETTALALARSRAIEREVCARLVEGVAPIRMGYGGAGGAEVRSWDEPNPIAQACARAIRSRGQWTSQQASEAPAETAKDEK